jgi:uncharacterized protein (TIGR03067 family)
MLMRALMLIAFLAIAVPDREDPTPKEKRPLQEQLVGDWMQVKRVVGGREDPSPNALSLAITRETLQHVPLVNGVKQPGESVFKYSLDTTKNPAVISFRDSQYEGILKIEGDLLTICYSGHGEPQPPQQFGSPIDSAITLIQATRIKK